MSDRPNLRATWSGAIQFGMVNIPIKLYKATDSHKSHLHEGCPTCGNRLNWEKKCNTCNKTVAYADKIKLYQVDKQTFVKLTKEDMEKIESKVASKTIPVTDFADPGLIDEIAKDSHYFAGPDNKVKGSETPFFLFQQALADLNKVAIGKVVLREMPFSPPKEHLVMISAYEDGLLVTTLHWLNDLRSTNQLPTLKGPRVVEEAALALGKQFVELSTRKHINLGDYKDEMTGKLEKLVEEKLSGKKEVIILETEPNLAPTVNLVAALTASLNKEREKVEVKT